MDKAAPDREAYEKKLEENEFFLRESQRAANVGSYLCDFNTGIWKCSEALNNIFGIDDTFEKTVDNWLGIIHPDDQKMMETYLNEEILDKKNSFNKEYRIVRVNDKAVRWVYGLGKIELDKEKDIFELIGTIQDITDRKVAQEKLRESEANFRNLSDNSPNMIFINCQGRVVYVNKKCTDVLGYSKEHFLSKDFDFMSLIAEDSKPMIYRSLAQHAKREEVPPYEYVLVKKDGSKITGIISTKLITYSGKTSILGIVTDISRQKKTEVDLKTSEDLLNKIINSASDMIFSVDEKNRITSWNSKCSFVTGFRASDVLGKDIMDIGLFLDVEQIRKLIGSAKETSKNNKVKIKTKKGRDKELNISVSMMQSLNDHHEGHVFVGQESFIPTHAIKPGTSYLLIDNPDKYSIFSSLIGQDKKGIIVSRYPDVDFVNDENVRIVNIDRSMLEKGNAVKRFQEVISSNGYKVIMIERLDYLITASNFNDVMNMIYDLNDFIRSHNYILLLTVDSNTLDEKQLNLLRSEMSQMPGEGELAEGLEYALRQILGFIYRNTVLADIMTSYKEVKNEFGISSVTTRKRIEALLQRGYLQIKRRGRKKVLILTEKGMNITERMQ